MSRGSVLVAGRAFVEAGFTETIRAGLWVEGIDPATYETVRTLTDVRYSGVGLVKYPTLTVSDQAAVGQQFGVQGVTVKIPISAALIPEGHTIIVDASTADPSLVGREFLVKGAPQSGQTTSHRYPVSEV